MTPQPLGQGDAAVEAALRVLTGKALFLEPREMKAALSAAYPLIRAQVITEVVAWLRGDEAEEIARNAAQIDLPPEDALAHAIEQKWLP